MKRALALFLGLLFSTSFLQPQRPVGRPTLQTSVNTAPAELVTMTNAWTEAINANDRAKLETVMAPEYAAYGWNGELWAARSQWLDNVHCYRKNTLHEISPRVYGDFAIVTSVATFVFTHEGHSSDETSILVDTWRMTNGRWQVVTRTICRTGSNSSSTASPCS
jgi:ketosteroid isomerase-like protein